MKVVIIEDEKLTANDLVATIVQVAPEAEVVAILTSVEEATTYFKQKPNIDLIFSDIELGDGQSFNIFNALQITVPIIFCTAYSDYALQAFETAGVSYILKPFSNESVAKAINKVKALGITQVNVNGNASYIATPQATQPQLVPVKLPNIIVYHANKIIPVAGEDIVVFFIENMAVKAFTINNEYLLITNTLDEMEKKFSSYFFRANRQFLVNRIFVKEAEQQINRKLLVHLNVPFIHEVFIAKEKVTTFLSWLTAV
jgi:two-component system, LytTR family, response regulator LytT